MPNYGDASYWDDRYTQQKHTTFDWLESWNDVKEITEKHAINGLYDEDCLPIGPELATKLKDNLKLCNIGCGNSVMSEDMYDDGYKNIWNMDISEVCIH